MKIKYLMNIILILLISLPAEGRTVFIEIGYGKLIDSNTAFKTTLQLVKRMKGGDGVRVSSICPAREVAFFKMPVDKDLNERLKVRFFEKPIRNLKGFLVAKKFCVADKNRSYVGPFFDYTSQRVDENGSSIIELVIFDYSETGDASQPDFSLRSLRRLTDVRIHLVTNQNCQELVDAVNRIGGKVMTCTSDPMAVISRVGNSNLVPLESSFAFAKNGISRAVSADSKTYPVTKNVQATNQPKKKNTVPSPTAHLKEKSPASPESVKRRIVPETKPSKNEVQVKAPPQVSSRVDQSQEPFQPSSNIHSPTNTAIPRRFFRMPPLFSKYFEQRSNVRARSGVFLSYQNPRFIKSYGETAVQIVFRPEADIDLSCRYANGEILSWANKDTQNAIFHSAVSLQTPRTVKMSAESIQYIATIDVYQLKCRVNIDRANTKSPTVKMAVELFIRLGESIYWKPIVLRITNKNPRANTGMLNIGKLLASEVSRKQIEEFRRSY